jgi:hypothetical protein
VAALPSGEVALAPPGGRLLRLPVPHE